MAIYGSLLTMPLADVLQWIKTTTRSGILTVTRAATEWELTVERGVVGGYYGPELKDNLGHIMVTSGLLTEDDLRRAYQHRREHGGSLQKALLDTEFITHEDLRECLTELVCESIYDLFIELPGEFFYSDQSAQSLDIDLDDVDDRLPLDLDINHLLMEGARRQDEWENIRERFPRDDLTVDVIHENLPPIEDLQVRERRILASLSAGQSISDICLELRAPVPSVLRSLMQFLDMDAIRVRDPRDQSEAGSDRVQRLMEQARLLMDAKQYDESIALLEVAIRIRPDSEETRTQLREALEEQLKDLYTNLAPFKIPVIMADDAKLRRIKFRPEERALLDRLWARMDIGSVIMVSSLNERETLKTLRKFVHSGIVELQ